MTSKLEDIKSGFQNQRKKQKNTPQINLFFYIVIQLSKVSNLYKFIKKFQNQYLTTEESSIYYEKKNNFSTTQKRLNTTPELYYMYSLFWSPL